MVLVDGAALGSPLPTPLTGTFINVTYAIVTDLLNTLSGQDVVNIITYGTNGATNLSRSPVNAKSSFNSTHLPNNAIAVSS